MQNLTNDQIDGLIRLINDEISLNKLQGDDAYNFWWMRVKDKLVASKEITKTI